MSGDQHNQADPLDHRCHGFDRCEVCGAEEPPPWPRSSGIPGCTCSAWLLERGPHAAWCPIRGEVSS